MYGQEDQAVKEAQEEQAQPKNRTQDMIQPGPKLHGEIYQIFFVELGNVLNMSLKGLVVSTMSWCGTGYFSNSTNSFVAGGRFSPPIVQHLNNTILNLVDHKKRKDNARTFCTGVNVSPLTRY